MSDGNSAVIAYGIDLGGPSKGWKVREVESTRLTTDWARDIDISDNLEDYFPSTAHLGVEIVQYADYEYPRGSWPPSAT